MLALKDIRRVYSKRDAVSGETGPALAMIPKSDVEKRLRIVTALEATNDTRELMKELYVAFEGISQVPGVVEDARWALYGEGIIPRVGAEWIVDEARFGDLGESIKCAIKHAIIRWSNRRQLHGANLMQLASFLERAGALEARGMIDSAMDLIYDSFDELLRRGQFALCDSILTETDPNRQSADVLLAVLTVTAPARSRLSARQDFYRRVKKALKSRKEYERGLLDGLG